MQSLQNDLQFKKNYIFNGFLVFSFYDCFLNCAKFYEVRLCRFKKSLAKLVLSTSISLQIRSRYSGERAFRGFGKIKGFEGEGPK